MGMYVEEGQYVVLWRPPAAAGEPTDRSQEVVYATAYGEADVMAAIARCKAAHPGAVVNFGKASRAAIARGEEWTREPQDPS